MKKKIDAENSKLHELEKAEEAKEKANRTKIHIQSRVVMVAVTGGLCLVIAFFGVFLAYKLRVNPDVSVSQSNSEPVSVQSSGKTQEAGNSSSSLPNGNEASFGGTDSGNSTVSVGSVQPNSQAVSVSGIPSIGGGGNVSFPPSGQIYEPPASSVTTDEPNSVMTSADGNTHEPETVDTQTSDVSKPATSSQVTPSSVSGNNGSSQSHPEGWSPFDDLPFFSHVGRGQESTVIIDEQVSETGITGEGFFH